MSKFLSLVEENTPGEEQEPLADKFHRFADKVSAFEEGHGDVDELLLELNGLNEELTTLGGVPEAEDYESMASMKSSADTKELEKVAKAIETGEKLKASSNPKRPSRGVKQVDKAYNKLAKGVAKVITRAANEIR